MFKAKLNRLLPILACFLLGQIGSLDDPRNIISLTVTKDGNFELDTPASWRQNLDVKFPNNLAIKDSKAGAYLTIQSILKADVVSPSLESFDHSSYKEIIRNASSATPSKIETFPTCAGKGRSLCRKVDAIVENYRLAYYYCSLDCADSYHQLIFWTMKSSFEKYSTDFIDMAKSFRPANLPDITGIKPKK